MIETGSPADLAALATLRDVMLDADVRADAAAFVATLDEDVVIMAPGMPVLTGRDHCAAFVSQVLAEYPQRRIEETIAEVHDPELGRLVRECGTALRVYRRTPGGWKMARVMWHADAE